MAVSAIYSSPVSVNGFSCRSCADVSLATKRIDPAHPQSGPENINAATDPSRTPADRRKFVDAKDAAAGIRHAASGYSATGAATGSAAPGLMVDRHA